jgi:hypothetical protein
VISIGNEMEWKWNEKGAMRNGKKRGRGDRGQGTGDRGDAKSESENTDAVFTSRLYCGDYTV